MICFTDEIDFSQSASALFARFFFTCKSLCSHIISRNITHNRLISLYRVDLEAAKNQLSPSRTPLIGCCWTMKICTFRRMHYLFWRLYSLYWISIIVVIVLMLLTHWIIYQYYHWAQGRIKQTAAYPIQMVIFEHSAHYS